LPDDRREELVVAVGIAVAEPAGEQCDRDPVGAERAPVRSCVNAERATVDY